MLGLTMLALEMRVSDDIELDLVGPETDKPSAPGPMSSPSADPGWLALSSTSCELFISGISGDPLFGRGCGRMSGE